MSGAEQHNLTLEREAPALFAALSALGRRAFYPPDIPFQAQQAKGKRYNATIGQITDGAGHILALPTMDRALGAFDPEDRNRALLYSPIDGLPELRERWREWHRPKSLGRPEPPSSLPSVTCGLTHALALVADLFGGPGRKLFIPAPFWGNYRQTFGLRTGAEVVPVPAFESGRFDVATIGRALEAVPEGEPVLLLLNIPANPTGYSPSAAERSRLIDDLLAAASRRPVVVICDDAYANLVYEPEVPAESLFWELAGRHPSLIPLKVAGSTKEFVFFGGRVGFLTFPYAPDSAVMGALENKVRSLIRAGIGSPPALSQVALLQALREERIGAEIAAVLEVLTDRYRVLRSELERAERESGLFKVLPFNSGAFALIELHNGVDAEAVRRHLLEHEDVGLVSMGGRFLRIAFCSLDAQSTPGLVERLVRGVGVLAGAEAANTTR